MNFDDYWRGLVNKVYGEQIELQGDEEQFYRLSCIYGESMVDGLEAYFERRFEEFEADMDALRKAGFGGLVSEYESVRILMFGEAAPLERGVVETAVEKLLDEPPELEPVIAEINKIYQRVIPQLNRLADYKNSFGAAAGLFDPD